MRIKHIDPATLVGADYNPRQINEEQLRALKKSLRTFGFVDPVVVNKRSGRIVGGHQRTRAAVELGFEKVPVVHVDLSEDEEKALNISLNQISGDWKTSDLAELLSELTGEGYDFRDLGFSPEELDGLLEGLPSALDVLIDDEDESTSSPTTEEPEEEEETATATLAERFGVVPLSVLNARAGQWQARKRAWLSLGIESEVGRNDNLLGMSAAMREPNRDKRAEMEEMFTAPEKIPGFAEKVAGGMSVKDIVEEYRQASATIISTGTSIFDPVLCELVYRWFCPDGGKILDPFAGGSVRGIVASKLGRKYQGVELRGEQVEANRRQGAEICKKNLPVWTQGDSRNVKNLVKRYRADLVFSCPPYADLEVYSDDPADLSTMSYEDFREAYREIIKASCSILKDDRFAVFVVGDVRGKSGGYYNFVGDTVEAFRDAGLEYYNEGILIKPLLPMRVGRTFAASRKFGKTHQNVLVFVKGCGKKATEAIGECDFGEFGGEIVGDQEKKVDPVGESTEFGIRLRLEDLAGEVS